MIGLSAFPLCGPSGRKSKITIHDLVVPLKPYYNIHPNAAECYKNTMEKCSCMLGGLMIRHDLRLPDNDRKMCSCAYCSAFTYISLESQGYRTTLQDSTSHSLIDHIINAVRRNIPVEELPEEWSKESDKEIQDTASWKFVNLKQHKSQHGGSYFTWNVQNNGSLQLAKRLISIICPTFTTVCNTYISLLRTDLKFSTFC